MPTLDVFYVLVVTYPPPEETVSQGLKGLRELAVARDFAAVMIAVRVPI